MTLCSDASHRGAVAATETTRSRFVIAASRCCSIRVSALTSVQSCTGERVEPARANPLAEIEFFRPCHRRSQGGGPLEGRGCERRTQAQARTGGTAGSFACRRHAVEQEI